MKFYELRRTPLKNKKYYYLYEIIVEGEVIYQQKSRRLYDACYFNTQIPFFKLYDSENPLNLFNIAINTEGLYVNAVTFDNLLKLVPYLK